MLIGTVLKSLEIEDLVSRSKVSRPCYVARSFIGSTDADSALDDERNQSFDSNDVETIEEDDKFYEAPENLADSVDYPMQSPRILSGRTSQKLLKSGSLSYKLPSFTRISGLLPQYDLLTTEDVKHTDIMDSFVKAQVVICDRNSPRYNNVDKQVGVLLLSSDFSLVHGYLTNFIKCHFRSLLP